MAIRTDVSSIQRKLEGMIAAGFPVFLFGKQVVLPAEVEDFFESDEIEVLREYIGCKACGRED